MANERPIRTGDWVKLGPTAHEKHYVLAVFGDGTVRVRQSSTGKVRNVQGRRCVVLRRSVERPSEAPARPEDAEQRGTISREHAETHWCPQCGDFLTWCPEWKNRIEPAA